MKLPRKYITNISALQLVQLLRFGTLFLLGVVFVRHYSKAEIGQFETFIFIAGALSFYWLNGILQSFQALIHKKDQNQALVFFNAALLLLFFSALVVLFLVIYKNAINFSGGQIKLPFFNYLLVYILLSSPANLVEYIYMALGKPRKVLGYGVITYGLQFLIMVAPALLDLPLLWVIKALVTIAAFRFLWLLVLLNKYGETTLSLSFIKKQMHLALPIMGGALVSGSAQYIDGFIVTHFYDEATFAIFRYGARELPLALILVSALSNGIVPEFSQYSLNEALARLRLKVMRLMHLLFPITIFLLLTSNWLYPRIFSVDFIPSAKIFNVYLLLIISRILLPNTVLVGTGKVKPILISAFIEITLNVGLSILLIQYFGLIGVAFATVIAFGADKLYLMYSLWKFKKVSPNQYIHMHWYLTYVFILIAIYIFVDFYIYP